MGEEGRGRGRNQILTRLLTIPLTKESLALTRLLINSIEGAHLQKREGAHPAF